MRMNKEVEGLGFLELMEFGNRFMGKSIRCRWMERL